MAVLRRLTRALCGGLAMCVHRICAAHRALPFEEQILKRVPGARPVPIGIPTAGGLSRVRSMIVVVVAVVVVVMASCM